MFSECCQTWKLDGSLWHFASWWCICSRRVQRFANLVPTNLKWRPNCSHAHALLQLTVNKFNSVQGGSVHTLTNISGSPTNKQGNIYTQVESDPCRLINLFCLGTTGGWTTIPNKRLSDDPGKTDRTEKAIEIHRFLPE